MLKCILSTFLSIYYRINLFTKNQSVTAKFFVGLQPPQLRPSPQSCVYTRILVPTCHIVIYCFSCPRISGFFLTFALGTLAERNIGTYLHNNVIVIYCHRGTSESTLPIM